MKWVLVAGASGGIGRQVVDDLAAAGWNIYLHGHQHMTAIFEHVTQLQKQYPQQEFIPIQADLTTDAGVMQLINNLFQLDALVYTTGITYYGLLTQQTSQQWETLWQLHVKAPMLLCQQLQTKLAHAHHGRIILIGSVYGKAGSAMEVAYSTMKGAQSAFAKAYAQEIASLGITINVIAPGAVDTPMNQLFSPAEKAAIDEEIPVGRFAQPAEITYFVKSLLAPQASYLTGQTLYVSGGWLY
ncbi:MAG: SDR family NAD(P)-dependent oxidoreductase [Candidatus Paralactobacillus gallistercoris]|uniref:SDR family NAD(P)-dependent oxidoreductase n=1 Tax=Candidatus Paralactobacillus gallistercoris TaxID=2838724 RepID=A0A948TI43_9LACO|nr:SDR family NAD(P)-dependent oxidoreductase [Candidatus Paralactobacillus gallistercoris]